MYQKEFEKLLHRTPPRALLLYGENPYLIEQYIQFYIQKTEAQESLLTQYYDEYDFQLARNYLSQSSLFGGTNLLIIKRDKKIPPKELQQLVTLTQKSSSNYFIFEFQGSAKEAKALQRIFNPKEGANWVRLFEPSLQEGVAQLEQRARNEQINIDRYALQHLLLLLNNNLSLANNELTKLSILKERITAKDIDRLVYSTAPVAQEQLFLALFEKKPIITTLHQLLELGTDTATLLRACQLFVQQIFLFHAYMKLHGRIDSKAILGYQLPKMIEAQKAQLALKIKTPTFGQLLEHLLSLELQIKRTPSSGREALLYGGLIKLQSFL